MKHTKTLIAGAVLAAVSGTAFAETSVTLYGLVDLGLVYQRGKVGVNDANRGIRGGDYTSRFGMNSGNQSGSRFGLRGVEDLGDGLQANFVLENGFLANNGTRDQGGRLFGRRATVGLSHDAWGSIDLGRTTNIASDWFGNIDPFGTDFWTASAGTTFSAANTVRYDNMVLYTGPNIGGFQGAVGYSFSVDDVAGPTNFATRDNSRAVTAGLRYSGGPLQVVFTYDQQMLEPSQPSPKQFILGAAYDFEVVKLSLAYGRTTDGVMIGQGYDLMGGRLNDNTPARGLGDTNSRFTWDDLKINSYLVGVSAPIGGASSIFASWQRADPNQGLDTTDVYSVGYTYDLSKRTNLYAFGSYADDAAFVAGDKMTTVGVGLRHRF